MDGKRKGWKPLRIIYNLRDSSELYYFVRIYKWDYTQEQNKLNRLLCYYKNILSPLNNENSFVVTTKIDTLLKVSTMSCTHRVCDLNREPGFGGTRWKVVTHKTGIQKNKETGVLSFRSK